MSIKCPIKEVITNPQTSEEELELYINNSSLDELREILAANAAILQEDTKWERCFTFLKWNDSTKKFEGNFSKEALIKALHCQEIYSKDMKNETSNFGFPQNQPALENFTDSNKYRHNAIEVSITVKLI